MEQMSCRGGGCCQKVTEQLDNSVLSQFSLFCRQKCLVAT